MHSGSAACLHCIPGWSASLNFPEPHSCMHSTTGFRRDQQSGRWVNCSSCAFYRGGTTMGVVCVRRGMGLCGNVC
ncbi:hypothetical protein BDA96_07G053600 [Sorghum bicolor]|uniref:Uncharacterized protein n=1 Tax=Sorghum bicolor TaxID=4558 RepID=A0A921U8V5_SORBI|nr:hypothetical protein BDA96_07G053600 [Sorghum bicolor]